jgi:phage shock protein A
MSKIALKNTPIQNIKSDISKLIDKVEDLEQKIINLNAKILIMVQRKKLSEDVPKTRHCHHRKGDK